VAVASSPRGRPLVRAARPQVVEAAAPCGKAGAVLPFVLTVDYIRDSATKEPTMGFTDKFRAQHDDIMALANEISQAVAVREPDVPAVRKQLSLLAGKVSFHLAMEDQALYPRLQAMKGSRTAAVATRFQSEMGGLAEVFSGYNTKWQVSAIRADLPGFTNETRKVFGALAHRISRETSDLYPLADEAA
jgi:hypothetical protein